MPKQELPENVKTFFSSITHDFEDFTPLIMAAKKVKVEPGQLVAGSFLILMVLIVIGAADFILTALVGILYPSFMSFKALHYNKESEVEHWLTYWILFAFLIVIDTCFCFLTRFIPFYSLFKLLLLVWLFYPKTKGAQKLYRDVIKPKLEANKEAIEKVLSNFLFVAETKETKRN